MPTSLVHAASMFPPLLLPLHSLHPQKYLFPTFRIINCSFRKCFAVCGFAWGSLNCGIPGGGSAKWGWPPFRCVRRHPSPLHGPSNELGRDNASLRMTTSIPVNQTPRNPISEGTQAAHIFKPAPKAFRKNISFRVSFASEKLFPRHPKIDFLSDSLASRLKSLCLRKHHHRQVERHKISSSESDSLSLYR